MNTPSIELSHVSVCYRIYKERVFSLKENVIQTIQRFGRLVTGNASDPGYHDFWAIRDLNFSVPRGIVLGLHGKNGSGKSTTLKVVSGVLHPTEGELWVRGRISALVELGAGFDPELTGRENILFGASVAGLSRKEAFKKMDSIIEFSELGNFIDIPVKNYSSGMYARLGFSLATDVDPDVLIVDEILSVGDASFQAKCLERMNRFKQRNKTILFVSHDATAAAGFCDDVIQLEGGKMVSRGTSLSPTTTNGLGSNWTQGS